jgi:PleD family two-component response regulator
MITSTSTHYSPGIREILRQKSEHVNVMIIGNNPIELTNLYSILSNNRSKNYIAEVCFSVKDSLSKMLSKRPDCILLDDNLVVDQIKTFFRKIKSNSSLSNIPIVLLKSTNFSSEASNDVNDYLLKNTIDADVLNKTIEKNIGRIKRFIS